MRRRAENRVWQTDFSEFETSAGGTWRIGAVVDYAAKLCLAVHASGTQTARDAVCVLEAAIAEAERLLARPLREECLDPTTGELHPLVIVSDNGPAFKSDRFALFIAGRPELRHVRTKHHAPETNGVVERFYESLKYEHLYRLEVTNGHALTEELDVYKALFNEVRPHEHLDFRTPQQAYLAAPEPNLSEAETVQET
jgi:putative transposase